MTPLVQKLVTATVAILAFAAMQYVTDPAVDDVLMGLGWFLLGGVGVRRPGDAPTATHPDDVT